MEKKRAYQWSQDLGVDYQHLVDALQTQGVEVTHPFNVIDVDTIAAVQAIMTRESAMVAETETDDAQSDVDVIVSSSESAATHVVEDEDVEATSRVADIEADDNDALAEFVLLDFGVRNRRRIWKLRKGQGPLMARLNRTIEELQKEGGLAQDVQTLIVIVESKP